MNTAPDSSSGPTETLYRRINHLYHGDSQRSRIFRWSLLAFDSITILYFIIASFFSPRRRPALD